MANIIALSITDTKANRSSVRIGEYVLPVKEGPSGGEIGEEASGRRRGGSNPVSMIRRSEMVRTPSTEHNMVQLSQAVLTGRPIIVQGGSGAGKSFLIRELAVAMNKAEELVELHVNDQTDAKALIGAYVCSDIPGEFIWQYGVLTQAVLGGRWVVVENIDSVPVEFLASIAPLLSRRRLHLPNRNMEVSAHPSFRLFGTRVLSSKSHRVGVVPMDYNSLIYIPTMHHFSYDWHYVTVLDMDSSEVKDVLMQKFPQLLPEVVHRLMEVHQLLNDSSSSSSSDQSRSRRSINQSRKFGLREMIKVAARIRANCGQFNFTSGRFVRIYLSVYLSVDC
jgi:midasin